MMLIIIGYVALVLIFAAILTVYLRGNLIMPATPPTPPAGPPTRIAPPPTVTFIDGPADDPPFRPPGEDVAEITPAGMGGPKIVEVTDDDGEIDGMDSEPFGVGVPIVGDAVVDLAGEGESD